MSEEISRLTAFLSRQRAAVPARRTSPSAYAAWEYKGADDFMISVGQPPLDGVRMLDLGCGYGGAARRYAELGASVTGIDIDADRISWARRLAPGVDFRLADAAEQPFSDEEFELIVSNDVLEHLSRLEASLREVKRVLRRGGRFHASAVHWRSRLGGHTYDYITFPWAHLLLPGTLVAKAWLEVDAATPGLRKPRTGRGLDELFHLNHLTMRRLRNAAAAAGLRIESLELHPPSRLYRPVRQVPLLGEVVSNHLTAIFLRP